MITWKYCLYLMLDTSQALRRAGLVPSFVWGVLACIWDDDPIHINWKNIYSFFINCLPASETLKKCYPGLRVNKFVSTEMIVMSPLILLKHSRWHSGPGSLLACELAFGIHPTRGTVFKSIKKNSLIQGVSFFFLFCLFFFFREQKDPVFLRDKVTQKHSKEQFETAQKIEQEYSKYFTG